MPHWRPVLAADGGAMMARPESPVDHTVPALGMLAEYLRRLRRTAGLSYGESAVRSNCSAAHLKRAVGLGLVAGDGGVEGVAVAAAASGAQDDAALDEQAHGAAH